MAAGLVLAVAADREMRGPGERGEHGDEPRGGRRAHLRTIAPRELRPSRLRPGPGLRPRDERRARRKLGQPDVEIVARRVLLFAYAARQPAHGADAHPFTGSTRRSK